jgi:hypothetical protein
MQEHGDPSEEILVVDLSSDEEDGLPDTSRDEEFARRLFGDLNHGLLGPADDDNVIILSDSEEEEEVHEEDITNAEAAPPFAMNSLTPTVSAADAPEWVQDDNSDDGDEVSSP